MDINELADTIILTGARGWITAPGSERRLISTRNLRVSLLDMPGGLHSCYISEQIVVELDRNRVLSIPVRPVRSQTQTAQHPFQAELSAPDEASVAAARAVAAAFWKAGTLIESDGGQPAGLDGSVVVGFDAATDLARG